MRLRLDQAQHRGKRQSKELHSGCPQREIPELSRALVPTLRCSGECHLQLRTTQSFLLARPQ